MKVKLLTLEERKRIEELIKQGAKVPQIARLLGRSKNTIQNELYNNRPRETYNAEKVHKFSMSANERRRKSISKWIEANKPKVTVAGMRKRQMRLSERISILEQKIEIIEKIIKKERNDSIN